MRSPRPIRIIALIGLAVILTGLAAIGAHSIYHNHIVRDCGADCARLAPD
ncbi:MAG: hypothetical protein LAT81_00355 [Oceanicaulis sp.]|nr:hypothetical protein [Oceanicaulis sp.]